MIIRSQSGFFTVETGAGLLTCHLRGRLKQGKRMGNIAAVGDWVQVSDLQDGRGMIDAVEKRERKIARLAPTPRGEYEQIIIANPDQAVFIFACAKPEPHLGMLDRLLVIAERQGVPPLIVANKVDLVDMVRAWELFDHYKGLGYGLVYTSAKSGLGVDELRESLKGKISVFMGPSGVGKSSLLNAVQPGLGLNVRAISEATEKGRHTTVVREMFPLKEGGYVADTPGLKALALWDIEAEEIDGYFPELRPLVQSCQFNDCTHTHEPGCAVRQAVEAGKVHPSRYASFLRMRGGEDE